MTDNDKAQTAIVAFSTAIGAAVGFGAYGVAVGLFCWVFFAMLNEFGDRKGK